MARSWGDGGPTQSLHRLAFDLYETLAPELGCSSYRKLPVLSVSPQRNPGEASSKLILPNFLDGAKIGRVSSLGQGDDTAQITPKEFVDCLWKRLSERGVQSVLGTCVGVESEVDSESGLRRVTAVRYCDHIDKLQLLPVDCVVISAGPWSCAAEDWFQGVGLSLPMEGIKSTSIVWNKPSSEDAVDAMALFCGEDDRFGTHLEVYPRPDGTIYICGIGGSDYVTTEQLKEGAFLNQCNANQNRVDAAMAAFSAISSLQKLQLDRTQACMRPCPPDAIPYMGAIPGYEGAFINAGHNCWGIAWAPACGLAMAELIVDGKSSSIDLGPFDPCRFSHALRNNNRGRKRQGTSVGEQW